MKKTALLFVTLLLLSTILLITTSATEKQDKLPAETLLALWTFDNVTDPFTNEVSKGKLYEMAGDEKTEVAGCIEVNNGVAKIDAYGQSLYLQYSQLAAINYENHNNKTFFMKFYIEGTAVNNGAALIWHRSDDFHVSMKTGSTASSYSFDCKFFGNTFTIEPDENHKTVKNTWYYFALTLGDYNATAKTVPITIGLSGDGDDYQVFEKTITIPDDGNNRAERYIHPVGAPKEDKSGEQTSSYSYFAFGKTTFKYGSKNTTGITFYIDEMRFYDTNISSSLFPLLKQPAEIVEETEPYPYEVTRGVISIDAPLQQETTELETSATNNDTSSNSETTKNQGCNSSLISSYSIIGLMTLVGFTFRKKKLSSNE